MQDRLGKREAGMDERKIDFIVCVTESICCEECMRYISDLIIPDGYCIDVLTVFEAEGMTKDTMRQCRKVTQSIRFICVKTHFC